MIPHHSDDTESDSADPDALSVEEITQLTTSVAAVSPPEKTRQAIKQKLLRRLDSEEDECAPNSDDCIKNCSDASVQS